jgi:hypothetical protein
MKGFDIGHCVASVGIAAVLLAGCGGNPGTVPVATHAGNAITHRKTFQYTGGKQTFTVPDGVTQITVIALGAF